jgi:CRISPR/Cas system CMR subunit Cmr6 (Cas7 group RAMP superfamily)
MKISNIVVGRRRGLGFPGLFDFKWFDAHFRILAIALLIGSQLASCSDSFDARANLSDTEYQNYLRLLAPYIHKKPDGLSFTERFHKKAEAYYAQLNERTNSRITHFVKNDSVCFFFFEYRDLTSLFEHYRGIGGYFKPGSADTLLHVNLLYHTPRFTAGEMKGKAEVLFAEMVKEGNVEKYIGNREFIHTPNEDFYYDVKTNRWDYTANSSWNFLKTEQMRLRSN